MSARALKTLALPALLAGTSRQPIDLSRLLSGAILPDDPKAGLKALALTGQALRFERPAPPAVYAAIPLRAPSRRNVGEALRAPLVRLFGDGKSSVQPQDDLALGMALALERLRMQPHPFDFPRMDGFLRAHAERLGPDACAWVDRDKGVEKARGYFDAEALDDNNWRVATPARRQKYVEERRRQDADVGRALVEGVWPHEGADLRLRLLQALRPGLSAADAPFLETLANDRAARVRELAEGLLARLPGAAGRSLALKSAIERIVRGETGLLRKRPTLKLDTPANIVGDAWRDWVVRTFEPIELDDLSEALGLPPAEMIAAAKDERLLAAIAIMAFRRGDTELARQAYEATTGTSPWLEAQLFRAIADIEPTARQELAEFLVRKSLAAGDLSFVTFLYAHRCLEGPLSDALVDEILGARGWAKFCAAAEAPKSQIFFPLAALCPSGGRPALRAALAAVDAAQVRSVLQYFDILDSLERNEPP